MAIYKEPNVIGFTYVLITPEPLKCDVIYDRPSKLRTYETLPAGTIFSASFSVTLASSEASLMAVSHTLYPTDRPPAA
jgi:hypothetical protein